MENLQNYPFSGLALYPVGSQLAERLRWLALFERARPRALPIRFFVWRGLPLLWLGVTLSGVAVLVAQFQRFVLPRYAVFDRNKILRSQELPPL